MGAETAGCAMIQARAIWAWLKPVASTALSIAVRTRKPLSFR